ncbi:MAG: TfoX/Sxy family protein [Gammaproteobacteria bacterium]|nr:TfoX/Sxy family protein [Gammaproteobacteria bacterium]
MGNSKDFLDYLDELMAGIPGLRKRAMFGGHGIYSDDRMFALVADDTLYIKVDDNNRAAFEAEGSGPFVVEMKGKRGEMSYFNVPEAALEDPEAMRSWCRLGIDAALRAAAKKKPREKTSGKPEKKR